MSAEVDAAVTRAAREEGGRVIALLAHRFGSVDLADDVVQEALIEALTAWRAGVPDNPAAWLLTVARNRAIDRIRRAASAERRTLAAAPELYVHSVDPADESEEEVMVVDEGEVPDERLRLMLLCCHPALDPGAQVALTLRLVGGLSTPEIAAAFLLPEATMAQRIVRAKRKIRDAGIPLSVPADPRERVGAVLGVLSLVFNEAYLARGGADAVVRVDLAEEAIRLGRVLLTLVPEDAEVAGLLALMLFQHARAASRTDSLGELVLLEQQDRSRWDLAAITEANAVIVSAMARMRPGPFQVQALIAARHANARTAADTDWPAIASLYAQLSAMTGSPVVALNHAVAVAMADGPRAGLALLEGIDELDRYYLLHAARGELMLRVGAVTDARAAFARALQLTANPAERRHLERRIAAAG
ncbi:sigma-70 family RNA polymerase sigma factor [Microbacteriaceae bacterium VKM Ac-2854]|nr:sigma-70 family RNA polymerase sigma factor [Microbacteriaceae bacterium VKM Ac-2854]